LPCACWRLELQGLQLLSECNIDRCYFVRQACPHLRLQSHEASLPLRGRQRGGAFLLPAGDEAERSVDVRVGTLALLQVCQRALGLGGNIIGQAYHPSARDLQPFGIRSTGQGEVLPFTGAGEWHEGGLRGVEEQRSCRVGQVVHCHCHNHTEVHSFCLVRAHLTLHIERLSWFIQLRQ